MHYERPVTEMNLSLTGISWAVGRCLRDGVTPTHLFVCAEDLEWVSYTQPHPNRRETFQELLATLQCPLSVKYSSSLSEYCWAVGTETQALYGSNGAY